MGTANAVVLAPPPCEMSWGNLTQFPEGRRVLACIQCAICGTCSHGELMQYPPRRIIGMLSAGQLEKTWWYSANVSSTSS